MHIHAMVKDNSCPYAYERGLEFGLGLGAVTFPLKHVIKVVAWVCITASLREFGYDPLGCISQDLYFKSVSHVPIHVYMYIYRDMTVYI